MGANPSPSKPRRDHADNHPRLPAARYLRFKGKQGLKGLTKISRVTDNLCLEIKAGLNCQALRQRLWWHSHSKEECGARETQGMCGERARLQCYSCEGMSAREAPASRCKVPRREIIHGGFGLKGGSRFCASRSRSHGASPLPTNLGVQ